MTWFDSVANQSAATAVHVEHIRFVELDFPSGYVRFHTRTGTIAWGSGSPIPQWLGVGKLGSIEAVKEDSELRPNTVMLRLSGVDSALVTAAMGENYHGRAVRVYDGFLNADTLVLVADPEQTFSGIMDRMTVTLGQESGEILVDCESELARWERPRGLLYTHESQQLMYEGDRGFDMIPTCQSRIIDWTKRSSFFPDLNAWAARARAGR